MNASAKSLLERLCLLGARFMVHGGELRFHPASRMSSAETEAIREHRATLLGLVSAAAGGEDIKVAATDILHRLTAATVLTCTDGVQVNADAAHVYHERLAIADDLGMDTSPGSEAEQTARREARRVIAGYQSAWNTTREASVIDHALAAFEPLDGLTLVDIVDRAAAARPAPSSPPPDALNFLDAMALDRAPA